MFILSSFRFISEKNDNSALNLGCLSPLMKFCIIELFVAIKMLLDIIFLFMCLHHTVTKDSILLYVISKSVVFL